jgi:hypothetical protein
LALWLWVGVLKWKSAGRRGAISTLGTSYQPVEMTVLLYGIDVKK